MLSEIDSETTAQAKTPYVVMGVNIKHKIVAYCSDGKMPRMLA